MSLPSPRAPQNLCVAGVPGSGVGVSASILRAGGVATETAAFAELNRNVLASLDGSWQLPPSLDGGRPPALSNHMDAAKRAAAAARAGGATAWVDCQMLLLADLWREIDSTLHFVITIRNPLEAVLSLRHSHGIEAYRGFALCLAYLRCATDLVPSERRVVVHYDACLLDPRMEATRLLTHAGTQITREALAAAIRVVEPERRHFCVSVLDLIAACPPRELLDLYGLLCLEAGYEPDADVLGLTLRGRLPDRRVPATSKAEAQVVRVAELAREREQYRIRALVSEEQRREAEAQAEGMASRIDEAQRLADTQTQFIHSLRSIARELDPEPAPDPLNEAALLNWAKAAVDERARLRTANAALLEELYAVNRHREELATDLNAIFASESWKLGRALSWPLRILLRRGGQGHIGSSPSPPDEA